MGIYNSFSLTPALFMVSGELGKTCSVLQLLGVLSCRDTWAGFLVLALEWQTKECLWVTYDKKSTDQGKPCPSRRQWEVRMHLSKAALHSGPSIASQPIPPSLRPLIQSLRVIRPRIDFYLSFLCFYYSGKVYSTSLTLNFVICQMENFM